MSSHEAAASKPLYVSQQRIRWGDMDAFGHVNNTLYFRFMEQCRIEWLEEVFQVELVNDGPFTVLLEREG